MLCRQIFFIVAAFLMTVMHSLPSPPPDMGLKVIRQYEAEGDNITWHGDQTPAKRSFDTVDLNRRQCDSKPENQPKLTCWNNTIYTAKRSDCADLQAVLSGQQRKGKVERLLNSVCYIVQGPRQTQCCISMTMPILNVVDQEYLNFVNTFMNQCGDPSGLVAGLISPITTGFDCNNVCLSNHYNRCWWDLGDWK